MNTHKKCLLLNQDYTPIAAISWQRALYRTFKGTMYVVEYYKDDFVKSGHGEHPVPAVGVCTKYQKRPIKNVACTKTNIFIRDGFTCSYCGLKDNTGLKLSIDHIIPKCRWNPKDGNVNAWTNVTTSCKKCNINIKGNKLLSECGLKLKKKPTVPSQSQVIKNLRPYSYIPKEWELYIPKVYKDLNGET